MILSLDLFTARTGWAKFKDNGDLNGYGQITPNEKHHNFLKIKYTVQDLVPEMLDCDALVVEGIFLNTFTGGFHNVTGFELLARLSGAVINKWLEIKGKIPVLYKAVEARKLVGVKGNVQKAEIQLWAIRNFNLLENHPNPPDLSIYDHLIEAVYGELNANEIKRPAFKSRMDKISKLIEDDTFVGEDCADALLLGRAYVQDSRNKTDNSNPEQSVS
jgi:hypothetical protein